MTVKDTFRDKTRDELSQDLNFISIKAKMAEWGHESESIENSWYQRSLGVIDISESLIP